MWQELKADDLTGLKKYTDLVKQFFASDEYYEELSENYLARQLINKAGNLKYFLYDDGAKQMCYGIKYSGGYVNPYTQASGMWRVMDLSYWGDWGEVDANGVSQEAVRFGCDSIINKLNELGIVNWYVVFNMDTQRIDELAPELAPQARIFLQFLKDVQDYTKDIITERVSLEDGHFIDYFKSET